MGNGYITTFPLDVFTQRNFVPDFIRLKLNGFYSKNNNLFLSHPLGDLGVTYTLHLWLVGKPWLTCYSSYLNFFFNFYG